MLELFSNPIALGGLCALAMAGLVYALVIPYISGDRQKDKRVSSVTEARGRKVGGSAVADAQSNRRKSVSESLKEIEKRQQAKEKVTMRLRLQRAGLDISPRDFYLYSAISAVLCGGLSFALLGFPI